MSTGNDHSYKGHGRKHRGGAFDHAWTGAGDDFLQVSQGKTWKKSSANPWKVPLAEGWSLIQQVGFEYHIDARCCPRF